MKHFSYKLTDSNIYGHLLYRIHADQAKRIDSVKLLPALKSAVHAANKHLRHKECNIVVVVDPDSTIPEEGMGGYAGSHNLVRISLDIDHRNSIKEIVTAYLPACVAHELHHARRDRKVGYGNTLGEALVTEGLACAFEEMLYPDRFVRYAHALSEKELTSTWKKVQPIIDATDYSPPKWFFGADSNIPRWTGYSLGYIIVKSHMEATAKNPAQLVDTPAEEILSRTR